MHAIVCDEHGGPEVMQYVAIPQPEPATNEVLIRAEAIGVNYVDIMRRSGKHPAAPTSPFTPGIEVCGLVAANRSARQPKRRHGTNGLHSNAIAVRIDWGQSLYIGGRRGTVVEGSHCRVAR